MNILESLVVYASYQLIFWGPGQIAQKGDEILPQVSPKFEAKFGDNFVS